MRVGLGTGGARAPLGGVQGVHEASLTYQRHARLFCLNGNYTAHNWHSELGSQQGKNGGKGRMDIKGE